MRINPFKPNVPVNPYCFHGRINELRTVNKILLQAKGGSPSNLLILGERGIGKTSLLIYLNVLSTGKVSNIQNDKFNFLTIQFSLDRNATLVHLIKKINNELTKKVSENKPLREALEKIWGFVKKIEFKGIKYDNTTIDVQEDELIDLLTNSLVDTVKKLVNENGFDAVLILVDEADNAKKAQLGILVKNISEKLIIEGCPKLIFCLAGLPNLKQNLFEDHPSSVRTFEIIELGILDKEAINRIIEDAIKEANKQNKEEIKIAEQAKNSILKYSEGYPHFVQQIGWSSFDLLPLDVDIITNELVSKAFFSNNGALHKIGLSYYNHFYWEEIKEDQYRDVLNILADIGFNKWVNKPEIAKQFKGNASTLTNALRALTERGIIKKDVTKRGFYRLQWIGFAVWIKNRARAK